ncbi:hypothetical protein [Bradyrhizobium sp. Leo121]|uniref:hypothetical protein n=1 Tax=Bradyrhizobium sp. Leo121 TaxID=1571195 RepID=UPI00040A618D|nr:hypothetical protein [Bradyrhizobium sp. Leo121]
MQHDDVSVVMTILPVALFGFANIVLHVILDLALQGMTARDNPLLWHDGKTYSAFIVA